MKITNAFRSFDVSIKTYFVIGSALLAFAAVAQQQQSLGTVGSVQGLVTDTDGTTVTSTSPGEQIVDGERFVTSSNGFVTLELNNGCTIRLEPNQAITIDSRKTCRELIATVSPVGGSPGRVIASDNAARGLFAVAGLAAGGFALDRVLGKNPNLSGR